MEETRKARRVEKEKADREAYGFRGTFVDLGDLIRCPALEITNDGRVPTFVTCKDAMTALHRLPRTVTAQITELGVPDQLTAADDCDNEYYVKALGEQLVKATAHVKVITLSVPDDLLAGGIHNEHQYEFRLWGLHEDILFAFRHGQYLELRFAHEENYFATSKTMDVYQMHNVDRYIKPMLFGQSVHDRLRAAEIELLRSQRNPVSPSIVDDTDTLYAICNAIDYGAWLMAGYTLKFAQPHPWEKGSVLLLQRSPQTADTLSEHCKTAAKWWLERCAFCIGNGFTGSNVLHGTKFCRRGGADIRHRKLGRQIFEEDIKAQHGCSSCAFPGTSCERLRLQLGNPRAIPASFCQFREVIYDVVVGFCDSECYFYREHLSLEMLRTGDDASETENIAIWLSDRIAGITGGASQIVPIFLTWTRAAQEQLRKRST